MKKKNVEEKLADLLQAFQERKELSVNDISQLLSCNRQSVYNYVNRLSERGIELKCKKHSRTVYYHLVSDDTGAAWASCIPLTDKILRKYNIVQNLQTASATPKALEERYYFCSSVNQEEDYSYHDFKQPMDIGYSAFRSLIQELEQEHEIECSTSGVYRPTGRTIPILHHFSREEILGLFKQLKTLPSGSPYHGQLASIARKLEIIKVSCNLGSVSGPGYLTYGKNHEMLEQVSQWMKKLSDSNYTEKLIRVTYNTRSGQALTVLFQTGMAVYSVEKARLYLLGKEYTSDPIHAEKYHSIIDMSTIIRIEDTEFSNAGYQSDEYRRIFCEMFSISLEEPVQVTVRFDLEANVNRKIKYLSRQRNTASIRYFPEENQLEYRDTIRGLADFANYLRQFGRSVHVIAPAELKEKMNFSVNRTLARYEEDDHE